MMSDGAFHPLWTTRRDFVKRASIAGAACLLGRSALVGDGPSAPLKRVGIKEFAADAGALADLRKAVQKMRQLPPRHPFSWIFQANIHWRPFYPDYVYQQADESDDPAKQLFRDATGFAPAADVFNKCPHGNWWFLPWHRAYLYFFERILRWASGSNKLTLPYWNYADDSQRMLPEVFRSPTTDGKPNGPPNPLYLPSTVTFEDAGGQLQAFPLRDASLNSGLTQLTPYVTSTNALRLLSFTNSSPDGPLQAFGSPRACDSTCACGSGGLESVPHNQVHNAIGGNAVQVGDALRVGFMGDVSTAARDPIFWLHHSHIDRLWESWLAGKDRQNPQEAEWLDYEFTYYDVGKQYKPVAVTVTPRQLLSTKDLGYEYDRLERTPDAPPQPPLVATGKGLRPLAGTAPPPAAKIGEPRMMAGNPIKLGTAKAKEIDLPLQESVKPDAFRGAVGEKPESSGVLQLSVEGIEIHGPPGVYYDVYLGLPKDAKPTPDGPNYVGTITFFGRGHHGEAGHGDQHAAPKPFSVSLVVPSALREQLGKKLDPAKLVVTFIPQTGLELIKKGMPLKEPEERADAVTVRRVRLLLVQ
jgi:hypothetical protein